jgi:hypothetical protein
MRARWRGVRGRGGRPLLPRRLVLNASSTAEVRSTPDDAAPATFATDPPHPAASPVTDTAPIAAAEALMNPRRLVAGLPSPLILRPPADSIARSKAYVPLPTSIRQREHRGIWGRSTAGQAAHGPGSRSDHGARHRPAGWLRSPGATGAPTRRAHRGTAPATARPSRTSRPSGRWPPTRSAPRTKRARSRRAGRKAL